WHEKYYNPAGFEIKSGDIVFDIGANNGFFSIYAAKKAMDGKVYAFEPVPYLVEKIKKTIKLNNLKNIKVENIAIGDDVSKRIFYISKNHNGCHSLYKRNGDLEKIEISVIILEKYCEDNDIKKINFLKLDCEGAEYEIIKKESIDFIKNRIKLISMEYHDNITSHTHSEIVEILQNAGFLIKISNGFVYAKNENK
ncbi:MAG: FkbM family methyltransferase, partial [Patescibacteria group bacterium]